MQAEYFQRYKPVLNLPVSGIAGVGPDENIELRVGNKVHAAEVGALETALKCQVTSLRLPCRQNKIDKLRFCLCRWIMIVIGCDVV